MARKKVRKTLEWWSAGSALYEGVSQAEVTGRSPQPCGKDQDPDCFGGVEQQGLSHVAGGDADWCGHFGRQLPTRLNILLPYDAGIAVLGIYPKKLKTYVHIQSCT